jgi:hypothetical protein
LNLVQIFNADGTHLYATIQTISAERMRPTANSVVTLAEQTNGGPDVLVKWFYPGSTRGDEFVYPRHQEEQLTHDRQKTIAGTEPTPTGR